MERRLQKTHTLLYVLEHMHAQKHNTLNMHGRGHTHTHTHTFSQICTCLCSTIKPLEHKQCGKNLKRWRQTKGRDEEVLKIKDMEAEREREREREKSKLWRQN